MKYFLTILFISLFIFSCDDSSDENVYGCTDPNSCSYDSNVKSGGEGARVFGIGVSQQYRTDQVTVAMRLIAVQTGEVLMTVTATKTIASFQTGADVFRFFDMRTKALEIESGVAINEPTNYAVRSAIEYAVLQMIEKGEAQKLWKYKKGEKE